MGLAGKSTVVELFFGVGDQTDSAVTFVKELRPSKALQSTWVPCFAFDELVDLLHIDRLGLIKIDVEGSEVMVLRGMKSTLATRRVPILCEVLHRHSQASPESYRKHIDELKQLLDAADYQVARIHCTDDGTHIESIEAVDEFPDLVWHSKSHLECDYLLTPRGTSGHLQ